MLGCLRFYRDFFFIFSPPILRTRWAELNQNLAHGWKQVWLENACPKCGVSPPCKNRGPKNHFLRRLRNLTATLTAYVFRTKQDIDNSVSVLTTTGALLHRLETSWTLVHKRLQIGRAFLPTLRIIAIFSSLSFFATYSPSSLNRTQPKPVTCSDVSTIWKRMSEIWGILSPYKSEA